MNCSERSHSPRPGTLHVQTIPRRERALCDPCVEKLNNLGMDFRPRRGPLTTDLAREARAGARLTGEQGQGDRRPASAPVPPIAAGRPRARPAGGNPRPESSSPRLRATLSRT